MAYKAGLDYNLNYLTKNQNLMLRFASAFLLACATAKLCTTDANCTDENKKCKITEGSGVCRKFEEALVVQLVGAETVPANVDGAGYPTTAIKGTIYLTRKGKDK